MGRFRVLLEHFLACLELLFALRKSLKRFWMYVDVSKVDLGISGHQKMFKKCHTAIENQGFALFQ